MSCSTVVAIPRSEPEFGLEAARGAPPLDHEAGLMGCAPVEG